MPKHQLIYFNDTSVWVRKYLDVFKIKNILTTYYITQSMLNFKLFPHYLRRLMNQLVKLYLHFSTFLVTPQLQKLKSNLSFAFSLQIKIKFGGKDFFANNIIRKNYLLCMYSETRCQHVLETHDYWCHFLTAEEQLFILSVEWLFDKMKK